MCASAEEKGEEEEEKRQEQEEGDREGEGREGEEGERGQRGGKKRGDRASEKRNIRGKGVGTIFDLRDVMWRVVAGIVFVTLLARDYGWSVMC